jgi:protein TonB
MSTLRVPMLARALALGVALLVTALLALAIQRLVTPVAPSLAPREVPDLDNFIRLIPPPPPEEDLERQRLPDPPPLAERPPEETLDPEDLAERPTAPPSPGPLSPPVPDLRIPLRATDAGPWLGALAPTEGARRGGGEDGLGGAWLPVLPSVRMQPEYPFRARRRGIEGQVLVAFDVTADGATQNIEILEAKPPGVFDEAVLKAVRQWRFSVDEHRQLANHRWQYRVSFSLKGD